MDDLRNSAPVDTTVILSKDLGVQDPFSDIQVTIAELGTDAPTVSLYRFINAEETAYMELNGLEMIKLIDAYTAKHIFSAPHHVDIAPALHRAKNRIERLTDRGSDVYPAISDVLQDLLRDLAALTLPKEQQEQVEHFLDQSVSYVVPQFRKQEN